MTLQQFLLILRARWLAVLLTLLVTVGVTLAVSLWLPKQYTANTAVVLDVRSPDPVSGQMLQGLIAPGYMATQIDIITSERVATRVVRLLRLDEVPSLREQWQEETNGQGNIVNWVAALLQKYLEVKPARESNVVNIAYTGTNPNFAAAVANAFAQAYLDTNLELKLAPAKQYAAFFDEQTKQARDTLTKAQEALSTYQKENGIVSADERLDYETARLNEISSQLTVIQAQTTDSQSKRQNARADTVAEVMQNPVINSLKADISRLEAKLKESNVNLGPNHPQTQRAETELATLRSELGAETRKITASIDTTYEVGRKREAELKGSLERQKARVLLLNKQRDELNVLKRDIDTAQMAFQTLAQRATQTSVESQNAQTNIAVLALATPPTEHSKPLILLNALAACFLGLLLGVGLAIALELLNRKVRSTEDLSEALDLPVLGTIASASAMVKRRHGASLQPV